LASKKIKVDRWKCHCERCDFEWISRTKAKPAWCPKCVSARWDMPKKDLRRNE